MILESRLQTEKRDLEERFQKQQKLIEEQKQRIEDQEQKIEQEKVKSKEQKQKIGKFLSNTTVALSASKNAFSVIKGFQSSLFLLAKITSNVYDI